MNYPYTHLRKRIANAEQMDFTNFLVESGHLTEQQKADLIRRFDENLDAKEKLSQLIGNS
ncbi:hypothetical protein J4448_07580 [Candidatus Woesearchaeota archaeon]|nr:hypothetical protein [Candidatus Woesearchaeota archaeon]